jgi:RNA polymerase sigma factor (TIGR02999 family)
MKDRKACRDVLFPGATISSSARENAAVEGVADFRDPGEMKIVPGSGGHARPVMDRHGMSIRTSSPTAWVWRDLCFQSRDAPGRGILGGMADVTRILSAVEAGDPSAAAELLPLVYDELRKLAAARLADEKPGQTLQATALVHEAYLRLVGTDQAQRWNGRGHFFAAAAEAMRRILVNRARDKGREKRGGRWQRVDLDRVLLADQASEGELVAIDDALQELARRNGPCAELVKLRFFAGLTLDEAAAAMGIARRTANRYWAFARAWLFDALRPE